MGPERAAIAAAGLFDARDFPERALILTGGRHLARRELSAVAGVAIAVEIGRAHLLACPGIRTRAGAGIDGGLARLSGQIRFGIDRQGEGALGRLRSHDLCVREA